MKNVKSKLESGFILIAILTCFSCFRTEAQSGSSVQDTKKIALSWIETLNRHDTDALILFYDEHVQLESPNWEGIKTGRKEAKEIYSRYFTSTPDLTHELLHMVANDSAVVIEYRSSGTLKNNEPNVPDYMRGKKYILINCTSMDIRNGKIIRQATYFDQVSFLRQMGFFDRK